MTGTMTEMGQAGPGETTYLSIGKVAEQLGVSERTLRYYEQIGLLTPGGHSPGGCRRYTARDIERVTHIRELQEVMGYSLEEIHELLGARDRLEAIRTAYHQAPEPADQAELVQEALRTLDQLRARVQAKVERLGRILAELDARSLRYHQALEDLTERRPPA
ncbi:MAG: MerR family transcriptional regulator [Acidimicrobiales bacterium]|nr:MAG: MerR family transcriptional regulator [Acidimicrobiales bacterium]